MGAIKDLCHVRNRDAGVRGSDPSNRVMPTKRKQLLQDVLKKAGGKQRNLTLKGVTQLIAAAPDVALQADGAGQVDQNQGQGQEPGF